MTKYRWVFQPPLWITLVTLMGVTLLCSLGFWQLVRAQQKQTLLNQVSTASQQVPLSKEDLRKLTTFEQQRYQSVRLQGSFLNQYSILLDNKIKDGQVGYDLITPVALTEDTWLLINRGFIAKGRKRSELPSIPSIIGEATIEGYLDFSYRNPFILAATETSEIQWPLRMQQLDSNLLGTLWGKEVYPMLVVLNATAHHLKPRLSPQRHYGYAVQWFALGLTLLCFYVFTHLSRISRIKL